MISGGDVVPESVSGSKVMQSGLLGTGGAGRAGTGGRGATLGAPLTTGGGISASFIGFPFFT